jgi:hypothetical protein
MKLTLRPTWDRGNEKVSSSRQREAAWRWEENVEAEGRAHELSRVGGDARRNGATMRTITSAAQPQCGQTGSVGESSGVGWSSGKRLACRSLRLEQGARRLQPGLPATVGQQALVADFHEAREQLYTHVLRQGGSVMKSPLDCL